ncbi:hypothetical protein HK44_028680 [Pseudomonas fluorescens HK44]|uniref:Uncharacterized protein n=1 Tax=Pseudomonas fluorescens HK44 TaxID=1042209 RepID=A0A010SVT4_PSEFL|nr:hypothetical protein HK44_028680 [Pseudomonas fluorescens HK44]
MTVLRLEVATEFTCRTEMNCTTQVNCTHGVLEDATCVAGFGGLSS